MRKLNVFFDVDYTLVMWDGSLRNHARHVFEQIREAGHTIYVWSGVGIRRWDMKRHDLDHMVEGYFVKPLWDYKLRLPDFNVTVMPDFVIDDHKGVVDDFGGYHISDTATPDARELLEVLRLIEAHAAAPYVDAPQAAAHADEASEERPA